MNFPGTNPIYMQIGNTCNSSQSDMVKHVNSKTDENSNDGKKMSQFENNSMTNNNNSSIYNNIIDSRGLNNYPFQMTNIKKTKESYSIKNKDTNSNPSYKYYNFNNIINDSKNNSNSLKNNSISISNSANNFFNANGFNITRNENSSFMLHANQPSTIIRKDTQNYIKNSEYSISNISNSNSEKFFFQSNSTYSNKNNEGNNNKNESTTECKSINGIVTTIFNDKNIIKKVNTPNANQINEKEKKLEIEQNETKQRDTNENANKLQISSQNNDTKAYNEDNLDSNDDTETELTSTSEFFYDESNFKNSYFFQTIQPSITENESTSPNDNENDDNNENDTENENENEIGFYNHENSDNLADDERGNQESESEYDEDKVGYLLYLYYGKHNPNENLVFRRVCMRYGLQAWDELNVYLPWRSRADLRLTLMKMIKKQAIGEYNNVRADPALIGTDNHEFIHKNYKLKGGMWVNQKWDKDEIEKESVRSTNKEKYNLKTAEALDVDVPLLMNVNYIIKKMRKRKQSLILYNAALSAELEKRTGKKRSVRGMNELRCISCHDAKIKSSKVKLNYSHNISKMVYDVPDFDD